jgi:hypothetical protein
MMSFKVLTVVNIKIKLCWDVTTCNLVDTKQHAVTSQ